MKIAFITRSTLYDVPGGDTIQIIQTAKYLEEVCHADVDILLTDDKIAYERYDLFHFFNITRPADILFHLNKIRKPFVISPILIDYTEYDRGHRRGIGGRMFRLLPSRTHEYLKTLSRYARGNDNLKSKSYLWKGQRKSIGEIVSRAAMLLPNSELEYKKLVSEYGIEKENIVVPNGIDPCIFFPDPSIPRDPKLVLCAARIEGIKNQRNLILALNNTDYKLILVGAAAPNQQSYYDECRSLADANVSFYDHVPQSVLIDYYKTATVHVLASWFETCGLSSLEAAAMGCNIVITDKGYTREYFTDHAFYCEPGNPASIFAAIEKAIAAAPPVVLQQKIFERYTWKEAALLTYAGYQRVLRS